MKAVGKAALEMMNEVRRQFRENPGIMDYTVKPDCNKCILISTNASLKEMMIPGLLVILLRLCSLVSYLARALWWAFWEAL